MIAGLQVGCNQTASHHLIEGEVERAAWGWNKQGHRSASIRVKLADGRSVSADSFEGRLPKTGDRIILKEQTKLIGNHIYEWQGQYVNSEGKP
jgi:hypothetical protein